MAGEEPGWWVTLGFTSSLEPNDRLHIVASELLGQPAGTDGRIYLERFDQLYSADPGATEVRLLEDSIEVDLTDEARHALAFTASTLSFDGAAVFESFREVRRVLRAMQRAGYAVRVAKGMDE